MSPLACVVHFETAPGPHRIQPACGAHVSPLTLATEDLASVTCKRCQRSAAYFNEILREMARDQAKRPT